MEDSINKKIKIIGLWWAWCKAINKMISEWLEGVEFIWVNSDEKLKNCLAKTKLNIWLKNVKNIIIPGWTRDSQIWENAIKNHIWDIIKALYNTDMLFIVCSMWGLIWSWAAPIIAEIAKAMWILTIGIVTQPFSFERILEHEYARKDISNQIIKLRKSVDSLIILLNEEKDMIVKKISFKEMFAIMDNKFFLAVQWLSDLLVKPWDIVIEFNDIKQMMRNSGNAWLWICYGDWKDRILKATKWAIKDFWLYGDLHKAKYIILSVTGWNNLDPVEIKKSFSIVESLVGEEVPCMWGSVYDQSYEDNIKVTIIGIWLEE